MRRHCYTILTSALLIIFSSSHVYSDIYKWEDEDGNIHFTDDYYKIPPKNRKRMKKIEEINSSKSDDNFQNSEDKTLGSQEETKIHEKEESEKARDSGTVSIADVVPSADRDGSIILSGHVKNNTKTPAASVKVEFTLLDEASKKIASLSRPVNNESGNNILQPGETAAFQINTSIPFSEAASFNYTVKWRSFKIK